MNGSTIVSISRCNELFSTETRHPLATLIELPVTATLDAATRFGFHTVWLKSGCGCCASDLGWKGYDFSDAVLVALEPGEAVGEELCRTDCCGECGHLLCFHSSLTPVLQDDRRKGGYGFFGYRKSEALHLSQREWIVLEHEMERIDEELRWGIDESTHRIVGERISLFLDYVTRFYRRQFITRHDSCTEAVRMVDRWLQKFFVSGMAQYSEIPSVRFFAGRWGCSEAYFDDMLRAETGKYTSEYVDCKRVAFAEAMLKRRDKNLSEVAVQLGFPTDRAFRIFFERLEGRRPEDILFGRK